jgi:GNAT superfamily N-acetyltransferase
MNLEFRTGYWDDLEARSAFKEFMVAIHGLDFSEWESAGYWDDAYTPFSFFEGDAVVSSVCIYLLDAVIDGEAARLAQISGVGTLPGWRRRGLNRRLTEMGLDWAQGKQSGVFLFADGPAVPFYEQCGFRPIDESIEFVEAVPVPTQGGAVKLDPGKEDERDRIHGYARRRAPVSDRFGVLNDKLVMFHALYTLREHIFEIPDLDCIVFCRREQGRLCLFDIVGERIPTLEELYPYIADTDDRIIEFHFHADKLGLNRAGTRRLDGNNPFVRGAFPVEKPVFPFTSRA